MPTRLTLVNWEVDGAEKPKILHSTLYEYMNILTDYTVQMHKSAQNHFAGSTRNFILFITQTHSGFIPETCLCM